MISAMILKDWEHCAKPDATEKSLVVVPTMQIALGWLHTLREWLDHPVALLCRSEENGEVVTARVIVTTVSTLTLAGETTKNKVMQWAPFECVNIWDEVHFHAAPTYRRIQPMVDPRSKARWIGLTGTAFRRVEHEFQYTLANFSENMYTVPYARLREDGYLPNILWKGICASAADMWNIFPTIRRAFMHGRTTLIFFDRVELCVKYATHFKLPFVHGGVKHKEIKTIVRAFRNGIINVICTTPILQVGVDLPAVNCIIELVSHGQKHPASFMQKIGRASRMKHDTNKEALVISVYPEHEVEKMKHRVLCAYEAGIISLPKGDKHVFNNKEIPMSYALGAHSDQTVLPKVEKMIEFPLPGLINVQKSSRQVVIKNYASLHETLYAKCSIMCGGRLLDIAGDDWSTQSGIEYIQKVAAGLTVENAQLQTLCIHVVRGDFDKFKTGIDAPFVRQQMRKECTKQDQETFLKLERLLYDMKKKVQKPAVEPQSCVLKDISDTSIVDGRCSIVGGPKWMRAAFCEFIASHPKIRKRKKIHYKQFVSELCFNSHLPNKDDVIRGQVISLPRKDIIVDKVKALFTPKLMVLLLHIIETGSISDDDITKKDRKLLRRLCNVSLIKTTGKQWLLNDLVTFMQSLQMLCTSFSEKFQGADWQKQQTLKMASWVQG